MKVREIQSKEGAKKKAHLIIGVGFNGHSAMIRYHSIYTVTKIKLI